MVPLKSSGMLLSFEVGAGWRGKLLRAHYPHCFVVCNFMSQVISVSTSQPPKALVYSKCCFSVQNQCSNTYRRHFWSHPDGGLGTIVIASATRTALSVKQPYLHPSSISCVL